MLLECLVPIEGQLPWTLESRPVSIPADTQPGLSSCSTPSQRSWHLVSPSVTALESPNSINEKGRSIMDIPLACPLPFRSLG